jgi:hypothetical protein
MHNGTKSSAATTENSISRFTPQIDNQTIGTTTSRTTHAINVTHIAGKRKTREIGPQAADRESERIAAA